MTSHVVQVTTPERHGKLAHSKQRRGGCCSICNRVAVIVKRLVHTAPAAQHAPCMQTLKVPDSKLQPGILHFSETLYVRSRAYPHPASDRATDHRTWSSKPARICILAAMSDLSCPKLRACLCHLMACVVGGSEL